MNKLNTYVFMSNNNLIKETKANKNYNNLEKYLILAQREMSL